MKRPEVAVNFALTWDARISTRAKTPATFSSPLDKARMQAIRASCDALLVGRGTVVADRMSMTLSDAGLRARRRAEGRAEAPLRVVVSNRGALDLSLPLFSAPGAPIVVFTGSQIAPRHRSALEEAGAVVEVSPTPEVDLNAMLLKLATTYDVRRVVCEGGPTLLHALLSRSLVDELNVTVCPLVFGGEEAPTLTGLPGPFLPSPGEFKLEAMEAVDGECFLRYRRLKKRTLQFS